MENHNTNANYDNNNDDDKDKMRGGLDVMQSMIDILANRLEGLRTQCATTASLTQNELRSLEAKIVKMFSELLLTRARIMDRLPSTNGLPTTSSELELWLRIVGISPDSIDVLLTRVPTIELLMEKSEPEVRSILSNNINVRSEEVRRVHQATSNLRRCCEAALKGEKEPQDLYWNSWDRHHRIHHRKAASPLSIRSGTRQTTGSHHPKLTTISQITNSDHNPCVQSPIDVSPPESFHTVSGSMISPEEPSTNSQLSPSPPSSPSCGQPVNRRKSIFATTPPPKKKHQTLLTINTQQSVSVSPPTVQSASSSDNGIIKSRSNESTLGNDVVICSTPDTIAPPPVNYNKDLIAMMPLDPKPIPRTRLYTEPDPEDVTHGHEKNNLPQSPCTPAPPAGEMGHSIEHRFQKSHKVLNTCNLCQRQMFFGGYKCTECRYRCHKECKGLVPPSCGLPQELFAVFKRRIIEPDGQLSITSPKPGIPSQILSFCKRRNNHNDNSSPGSSCNSSTPSSPAVLQLPPQTPAPTKQTQFPFPDVCKKSSHHLELTVNDGRTQTLLHQVDGKINSSNVADLKSPKILLSDFSETVQSNDSDKTFSLTGSTSTDSEKTIGRVDSVEEKQSKSWPRQNSINLKEWDIPFDEMKLNEKIGEGRFGQVYRALWHGDVAVKLLKDHYLEEEVFKQEVAIFRKTRHENIVLFMGACMKPRAIVTALCKGITLYTHIHQRKDKFALNRSTVIAQQICQGMGYLHARDIVHKDLKTKNIFLEGGKVIITDFGLFSSAKLQYNENGLEIPNEWLCYLSPELMKQLKAYRSDDEGMQFTKQSDVYAFGTVWYEILCGEFPFKSQEAEAIIWQVGRGMKHTLANIQASRDIKDVLMQCWKFIATERPSFSKIYPQFERLPKKRLARSPSHPVQLSRSAESVF